MTRHGEIAVSDLIIDEGTHRDDGTPATRRLGEFRTIDGIPVPAYADTLLANYGTAITPPVPAKLIAGAGLKPTYMDVTNPVTGQLIDTVVSGYVADPTFDTLDTTMAAQFGSQVALFPAHVQAQQFLLQQFAAEAGLVLSPSGGSNANAALSAPARGGPAGTATRSAVRPQPGRPDGVRRREHGGA